jgi:hypothetical protein
VQGQPPSEVEVVLLGRAETEPEPLDETAVPAEGIERRLLMGFGTARPFEGGTDGR